MTDGSDVAVNESQSVAAVRGVGLIGKTAPVERPVQPISAFVAGEESPCPISSVSGGSQTHDEEASACFAEARDRLSPVFLVDEAFCFLLCDSFAPLYQSWTFPAGNDTRLKRLWECARVWTHCLGEEEG